MAPDGRGAIHGAPIGALSEVELISMVWPEAM
jgi:hypothetical protein